MENISCWKRLSRSNRFKKTNSSLMMPSLLIMIGTNLVLIGFLVINKTYQALDSGDK
jgi:hypothetical protein